MGTSSDYTGGVGGNWTAYKHAASNFARRGGSERANRALAKYVRALGGAGTAAASAATTGVAAGQRLADFGTGLTQDGLTPTLQRLGLGHLVGADRIDVLDGLLDALAGDGDSRDDSAVRRALIETFKQLFDEEAQTYEALESAELNQDDLVLIIERFVALWGYERMADTIAEKFAHIENPDEAARRYEQLLARFEALVKLEIGDRDVLSIEWRADEGEAILGAVIDKMYEDLEDFE